MRQTQLSIAVFAVTSAVTIAAATVLYQPNRVETTELLVAAAPPDPLSGFDRQLEVEVEAENKRIADYLAAVEAARQAEEQRKAAEREAAKQAERKAAAERAAKARASRSGSRTPPQGTGGDIAMRIARCEGYPKYVYADHGPESTASGKYGFLDGTWDGLDGVKGNGFRGYARAMYAPEAIQDEGFWILYRAAGTQPWNASKKCWGG